MNKLRLGSVICACVIAFSIVSAATGTAEAFVNDASGYGNQDSLVSGREAGAGQVKRSGSNSLATDLQDTVFVISCGLIGVFLLRMANKR